VTYVLDTGYAEYGGRAGRTPHAAIVIVGCGGTGAFLAERACQLLIGRSAAIHLVDHDRVEPHNTIRQAFARRDIGKHKAEVLADRLSRRFERPINWSTLPFLPDVHADAFDRHGHAGGGPFATHRLIVGCVDNAHARRAIAEAVARGARRDAYGGRPPGPWWLDLGNGHNSGQILLGNAATTDALRGAFDAATRTCRALPAPHLQRPDLLDAPDGAAGAPPAPRLDCAEAIIASDQSPAINAAVAALAANWIHKFLEGRLRWMAAYFDLDDGTLQSIDAEPGRVARIAGLHRNAVAPPVGNRRAA
jgi:PRTRC genetic system ThiF family protein